MGTRSIVTIDEEKCDGCGLCAQACAEGAIAIADGKARLVSETYCDGLGACLGECPQGAITIEQREAEGFDPEAVERHLQATGLERALLAGPIPSRLANWPVQIRLVPVQAPCFAGAKLLVAADCVPFALADFHRQLLADRVVLVGCPKLDDVDLYRAKLAQILMRNEITSVEVVHMEVACCHGLVYLVTEALRTSGKKLPLALIEVGIKGDILGVRDVDVAEEGEAP